MVDGRSYTFKEVDELSNAVANFFHDRDYKKVLFIYYKFFDYHLMLAMSLI